MKSLANEFFKQMQAGAEDYAAKNTDKFSFAAVGMKDERDFAAQVDAVENFITQQFNVIVLAPADSKAMVTPVKKALEAGIKVINIDVALDEEAKKQAGVDLAFSVLTIAKEQSLPAWRLPRIWAKVPRW